MSPRRPPTSGNPRKGKHRHVLRSERKGHARGQAAGDEGRVDEILKRPTGIGSGFVALVADSVYLCVVMTARSRSRSAPTSPARTEASRLRCCD